MSEQFVKLSELVDYTSSWLGQPATALTSYARALKDRQQISVAKSGGGAAHMSDPDKLIFLLSVAGCSTAKGAGEDAKYWFKLSPNRDLAERNSDFGFKFVRALTFHEALSTLMTVDLREGGEVARFIAASKADAEKKGIKGWLHEVTVSFYVDRFEAVIRIEREKMGGDKKVKPVEGVIMRYAVEGDALPSRPFFGYAGDMRHENVVHDHSLLGWGRCLEGSYSLA